MRDEYCDELSSVLGFPVEAPCELTRTLGSVGETLDQRVARQQALQAFFDGCLDFACSHASDANEVRLKALLFGRFSQRFGEFFHREMRNRLRLKPLFFRTDEPTLGQIAEIQCPGSLWGECAAILSLHSRQAAHQFIACVADAIKSVVSGTPVIHHLVDNSSRPLTTTYLIQALRRQQNLTFFGFDNVKDTDCNFVRSHSFHGLISQNIFETRLQAALSGQVQFDYPPTPIFDQKLPLALPFHPVTSKYFHDSARSLIAPTFLIEENCIFHAFGQIISLDEEIKRPRQSRNWVLKYAGLDTNRNWGSRSVKMTKKLSKSSWLELRKTIIRDQQNGDPWVVQADVSSKTTCGSIQNVSGDDMLYEKTSLFFAGEAAIGGLRMFRRISIVHGQDDTIHQALQMV